MRRRRAITTGIVLVSTLLAGSAMSPAASAAIPRMDIYPAGRFVQVPASPGAEVTLTLRRANGSLKQRVIETAGTDGFAVGHFDVSLRKGDRLTIARGAERRTITVLTLQLKKIDRVADVIAGRGTVGRRVRATVRTCPLGGGVGADCPIALKRDLGSGRAFRLDTTGQLNLRGRQHVGVLMRSGDGDRYRDERPVPFMSVDIHEPFVSTVGVPRCGSRTGALHVGPGGPLIATADIGEGCSGQFSDGGPVSVEPGHQVSVDFASDARMTIPALISDVDLAADAVTATCFADRPFLLQVFGGGGRDGGRFTGLAGPGGAIVIDTSDHPTEPPVDIVSGHDMRLTCQSAKGDTVRQDLTTP